MADTSFIPDLPKGPLDTYRSRAKFDWKKLRLIFENSSFLKIKYNVWNKLEADPLFAKPKFTLSVDDQQRLAALQVNRIAHSDVMIPSYHDTPYKQQIWDFFAFYEAIYSVCPSIALKISLSQGIFADSLKTLGCERNLESYTTARNLETINCVALTEVSHGSNTKAMRTTATYDPKTEEFVINTPDFESAKCWIGNLGKTGTTALLYAILKTADGVSQGLHGFVVPIRDPGTLLPYPGVLVGDIGEKIGLNGVDNGFVVFNNYRIPRENLLNGTSDVTPEGHYKSALTDPGEMQLAALKSLSMARTGLLTHSLSSLSKAVVISIRYAALRKQFGPNSSGAEVSIIEYQQHQWRLFPYLAAACVFRVYSFSLIGIYADFTSSCSSNSNGFELLRLSELHAVISASKPLITWVTRDAIQEAREACGGHGYLKAANLGELRNNHDATVTYEGDNNVLAQQAPNWLIKQWELGDECTAETVSFIRNRDEIASLTFAYILEKSDVKSFEFIANCYEWLICWLLNSISNTLTEMNAQGVDKFTARNNVQVYKSKHLVQAYAEYFALRSFQNRLSATDVTPDLKPVLHTILLICGYWFIDKHMVTFYQGNFASGPSFADTIRKNLLSSCSAIKDFSVSIADALAPPDFVLNSVLGKADGLLYQNLQNNIMTNPGALERPAWWKDVIIPKSRL